MIDFNEKDGGFEKTTLLGGKIFDRNYDSLIRYFIDTFNLSNQKFANSYFHLKKECEDNEELILETLKKNKVYRIFRKTLCRFIKYNHVLLDLPASNSRLQSQRVFEIDDKDNNILDGAEMVYHSATK